MAAKDAIHTADRLDRVFEVISAEARARPDFGARLLHALEGAATGDFDTVFEPEPAQADDALSFSLVAVLYTRGEDELRAMLNGARDAIALLRLAEDQHIAVDIAVQQASLPEVINAIVDGAKFRLSDRLAAAG